MSPLVEPIAYLLGYLWVGKILKIAIFDRYLHLVDSEPTPDIILSTIHSLVIFVHNPLSIQDIPKWLMQLLR